MAQKCKIKPEQKLMAYEIALHEGRKAYKEGRYKEADILFTQAQSHIEAYVVYAANTLALFYNIKIKIEFNKFKEDHHCINFIGGTNEEQINLATDMDSIFGKYKVAKKELSHSG